MSPSLYDPPTETKLPNGSVIIDFEEGQASQQWLSARTGIPTASEFSKIVTSQAKPSKGETRETYKHQKIVERLTHCITQSHSNPAMERGTALEPQARAYYEMMSGTTLRQVGFVRSECGRWGCSPDGLIMQGDACVGGVEIKCPLDHTCVKHLLRDKGGVPTQYLVQIQACLWVTKAHSWDFCLFSDRPEIPNLIRSVPINDEMHAAFDEHVPRFCDEIDDGVKAITEANQ